MKKRTRTILIAISFAVISCSAFAEDDPALLFKKYLPLAEKEDILAQFDLGFMNDIGEGVPQDYTEAARWYRKAAEQGYSLAQFCLALMYDKGKGVPKDYIESYAWYNISAVQGSENATKSRDTVAKELSPEQLAKTQELSREYFKKYVEPFQ